MRKSADTHCVTVPNSSVRLFPNSFECVLNAARYQVTVWKTSTIAPITEFRNAKEPSEFRPVALTSLVMKIFKNVIKDKMVSLTDGKLDPLTVHLHDT